MLLGAQFGVGVLGDHLKLTYFFVLLLYVCWKGLEEIGGHVHDPRTLLMGAIHLLKVVDFVYHIVMEAGLAKIIHVLALANVHVFVLLFPLLDLPLADLANCPVLYFF